MRPIDCIRRNASLSIVCRELRKPLAITAPIVTKNFRPLSSFPDSPGCKLSSSSSAQLPVFDGASSGLSMGTVFLGNDEVARLASQPLPPLTLRDLVRFGRPPLSKQALLDSARFTRDSLPIRLARRIVALRNLPFIVVSNDHISKIYSNYQHSLRSILSFPPDHPSTLAEEEKFTELLIEIVKIHSNTIPTLARGFIECQKYVSPDEVTGFLDGHLRARIGTRLMAEQHIALHAGSNGDVKSKHSDGEGNSRGESYIGTIDTALQPSRIIASCADFVADICEWKYGVRPELLIDGHTGVTFPYIPVHLEYMITELLKNAFRATQENRTHSKAFEPIVCTIAGSRDSPTISIRIRDRGGGINPEILDDIWKYSFTTFDREQRGYYGPSNGVAGGSGGDVGGMGNPNIDALNITSGAGGDVSSIAGLGYGLPLSRAYAEYFGGSLAVQSCYGWGTDVYLTLKSIDISS